MLEEIISKIDVIKGMAVALILVGVIVIAIVERIKVEVKESGKTLKSYWYTIISAGIGAFIFALFLYAPVIVIAFVFVMLLGAGIFDITKYAGGNEK